MVKLNGNMSELDGKLSIGGNTLAEGYYAMGLLRSDVTFPDGTVMGQLDNKLKKVLESMSDLVLDFEVLAPIRAVRETISKATQEKHAVVRVNINVYGRRSQAQQVGKIFSEYKVYLQRPDWRRSGSPYDNPHVLKLPTMRAEHSGYTDHFEVGKQTDLENTELFKKTISEVYSSLKRGHNLASLEGDDRLKTPLLL